MGIIRRIIVAKYGDAFFRRYDVINFTDRRYHFLQLIHTSIYTSGTMRHIIIIVATHLWADT